MCRKRGPCTGFQGSYCMGMGDYAENKTKSTKYVPFGRSWPPMITTSIPFPSNFRELTQSSHILFGRERTRLVHLTVHRHPCLPVEFPDHAAPFSHTIRCSRNSPRSFAGGPERCANESIDDRMTPTLACPWVHSLASHFLVPLSSDNTYTRPGHSRTHGK